MNYDRLEQELGYSNGSLAKAKDIPSSRIAEISKFLGVSMDFLMTGKEKDLSGEADILISVRNDKRLMQALKVYMTFSDKQKNLVLNTIENLGDLNND